MYCLYAVQAIYLTFSNYNSYFRNKRTETVFELQYTLLKAFKAYFGVPDTVPDAVSDIFLLRADARRNCSYVTAG